MVTDKVDNIDFIFDFVNNKYGIHIPKNEKANLHGRSKNGQLYYHHRAERVRNFENEYQEVLVICNPDEQKGIIHMGHGDSDIACYLGSQLGVDRTRANILERFWWENVGKNTKEFVLFCDQCQKVNPIHKINVGELHPVAVPTEVMAQTCVDITNLQMRAVVALLLEWVIYSTGQSSIFGISHSRKCSKVSL